MRIISDFSDYYDNVQGTGVDLEDVYVRNTTYVPLSDINQRLVTEFAAVPDYISSDWIYNSSDKTRVYAERFRFVPVVIGFCGKINLAFKFTTPSGKMHMFYNAHYLSEFIHDDVYGLFKGSGYFPGKVMGWARRFSSNNGNKDWGGKYRFTHEALKECFDEFGKIDYTDIFQQLKSPIFVMERHQDDQRPSTLGAIMLECDCPLDGFGYVSMVDPYTAFQEVSMYRNGVLGTGEPDMIEISDVHKRDAHGFDNDSFKNVTPGKKAKRKANREAKANKK